MPPGQDTEAWSAALRMAGFAEAGPGSEGACAELLLEAGAWRLRVRTADGQVREARVGPPERGDEIDNDGDGLVDENTSLVDDDEDGYAEVNGDCDDRSPAVPPGATEIANGRDDDCDGDRDDV